MSRYLCPLRAQFEHLDCPPPDPDPAEVEAWEEEDRKRRDAREAMRKIRGK